MLKVVKAEPSKTLDPPLKTKKIVKERPNYIKITQEEQPQTPNSNEQKTPFEISEAILPK